MSTRRPGTAPYYLTPDERDRLVRLVRRKAAKANLAVRIQDDPRDLAVVGERVAKAANLRDLLYALGATPTSPLNGALKGALSEAELDRYKKKIRRMGVGADDALTFLKITGWLDRDFKDGRIGVFLLPQPGAMVRVLLAGSSRVDEVLAREVAMHELLDLFRTIPEPVSRKVLIGELGFRICADWDAATRSP